MTNTKKSFDECLKEAKRILKKRYTTTEVAMLTLKLWRESK